MPDAAQIRQQGSRLNRARRMAVSLSPLIRFTSGRRSVFQRMVWAGPCTGQGLACVWVCGHDGMRQGRAGAVGLMMLALSIRLSGTGGAGFTVDQHLVPGARVAGRLMLTPAEIVGGHLATLRCGGC